MNIKLLVQPALTEIATTLAALTDEQYCMPCSLLNDASIGQHVRHIIELYSCVINAYNTGMLCYDDRKRDHKTETDKQYAIALLRVIALQVENKNKDLIIQTSASDNTFIVASNYYREILYNAEHTVHHMALIRVAVQFTSDIELPPDFGVASSTIKYRKECAQ